MKTTILRIMVVSVIVLMSVSCGKPDFIKDETWDVWVALNSGVDLSALRQKAAEDMIQYDIEIINNKSDLTEEDKNERLISATCHYTWLKNKNPLDSDGHIRSRDWYSPFYASYVTSRAYDEIMETFDLNIPKDEYMYYVNANEEKLKEYGAIDFITYGHYYLTTLKDAVSVHKLKKNKRRSQKGIDVYDVIYFVTAYSFETSGYVQCRVLVNKNTGHEEIKIINTSQYLLDL